MVNFKSVIGVDFYEKTKEFEKKDGIISIVYYFYYSLLIFLFGLIMFKTSLYGDLSGNIANKQLYKFLFYFPISILALAPIFFTIKIKNQKFESLGMKARKNLKSIILGIIFSLPFVLPSIIINITQGARVLNLADCFWLFLYFFVHIAFVEEIAFRGFIQTRIQGLIKNKWASILVVGIMFALMHIPFQMILANMSFIDFIIYDWAHLLVTFLIHIYLVYLYTRDNNILSTTVTHTLIDFIPSMFLV
ncbi:MAG: lysostaphin resistance A-like protein [Clostridiaceae bacterium]